MRLTALLPPPPTPRTMMRAAPSRLPCPFIVCTLPPPIPSINSHSSWQEIPQPVRDRATQPCQWPVAARAAWFELLLEPPFEQSDTGRESGCRYLIGQT